jgi:hypothetical protein
MLSALCTGRLYPQELLLELISVKRPSQPQDHSAARRIMSMTNSSDDIGNRTRDLPACSTMPQTTAPPPLYPTVLTTECKQDVIVRFVKYIFNSWRSSRKMASSKPKHVAMFSLIVYIIKLSWAKIILLLIIWTQFGLENFILGYLQIQMLKMQYVCNRIPYGNRCSNPHSEIVIDVSAARVQSVLMNDWCWSSLPLFMEAVFQSFIWDVLGNAQLAWWNESLFYFSV